MRCDERRKRCACGSIAVQARSSLPSRSVGAICGVAKTSSACCAASPSSSPDQPARCGLLDKKIPADLAAHPEGYGRKTFQSIVAGIAVTDAEYAEARRAGEAFRLALDDEVFSKFDALLTAGTLTPALPVALFGKGSVWTPMRTIGFNLSGHPVLMLPAGFSRGLPFGMQIVGRHHGEARICQIGDAFERATDFSTQRPFQPH